MELSAKRGNEKPRRGWNIHRIRLGREASLGITGISMSRTAVYASDAPDSESGGGLPRRPDRPSASVLAAKPERLSSAMRGQSQRPDERPNLSSVSTDFEPVRFREALGPARGRRMVTER